MSLFAVIVALILIAYGLPVAVSLGIGALTVFITFQPVPLVAVPQLLFAGVESYILVSIPFFIFVGVLMESSGIARNLIDFSKALTGWTRGGLGAVNIVSSFIFGGISGSSVADTVAIGSIMIPEMEKDGYPKGYSSAITVISSTLAVVIPPSILMILLGAVGNLSISSLLLGGIIPGILMCGAMLFQNYWITKKYDYGHRDKFTFRNLRDSFLKAIPALGVPGVIIIGILSGSVTPTESGGIAAIYTLIISHLCYKSISMKKLYHCITDTAKYSAAIMFVISSSTMFTFLLTYEEVPQNISQFLLSLSSNEMVILLLINIFILLVGMLIDAGVAIIVLVPILLPIIRLTSIDPIHFGVIFVINLAIGLVTPPFGVCLFSVCSIGKISMGKLIRNSMPLYMSLIIVLLIVTLFPQTVLSIPKLMMK